MKKITTYEEFESLIDNQIFKNDLENYNFEIQNLEGPRQYKYNGVVIDRIEFTDEVFSEEDCLFFKMPAENSSQRYFTEFDSKESLLVITEYTTKKLLVKGKS